VIEGIIFFILGVSIGSFLNVLILRHNTGNTILGRSFCFSCGKILKASELIPLLSFVVQGGRCNTCGSRISFQYPLVEGVSGILFAALGSVVLVRYGYWLEGAWFPVALMFSYWTIFSILLVISIYDIRHKIIPNTYVYSFIGVAFLYKVFLYWPNESDSFLNYVLQDVSTGFLMFLFFFFLWFLSRGKAMGLGDAKLAFGIGVLLGPEGAWWAFVASFFIGAVLGTYLLFLGRNRFTMKSEIPFGPFLSLGALLSLLADINIL